MTEIRTLNDTLLHAAAGTGAISHFKRDHSLTQRSYAQLHQRALALLGLFQVHGLGKASHLILLLEDTEPFIDCFWATQLGGIIPVPVAVGGHTQQRERLSRIIDVLGECHICTTSKISQRMLSGDADALARAILLDELYDMPAPGIPAKVSPGDIAFIQFSSGSTASPRGVILSHDNLLSNLRAICDAAQLTAQDNAFSWMPLTHDMGLIGFHLTPTMLGLDQTLMATELFVRRPFAWLQKASDQRSTLLCSPSFGYRHLLKNLKPDLVTTLDLNAVRLIFNGAEPISATLCEQFLQAMAPTGLKASTMYPVYGLAEASLAVCFPPPGRALKTVEVERHGLMIGRPVRIQNQGSLITANFVSVGKPVMDCELRIADDSEKALSANHLGRILIRGANVTERYHTESGELVSAQDKQGWLDTGDLGFIHDGELIVTGRLKETIVVNGHNYLPSDLESLLEPTGLVDPARLAVCGSRRSDQSTDEILVFVQHRGEPAGLAQTAHELTAALGRDSGLEITHIVPVKQIPRTTSGKPQRYKLVEDYQSGSFDDALVELRNALENRFGKNADLQNATQARLLAICNRYLVHKDIGVDQNLLEIGESSLTLAMVYDEIEATWPGAVEIGDLLEFSTIKALAGLIEQSLVNPEAAASGGDSSRPEKGQHAQR